MNDKSYLRVSFSAPLQEGDSESTTFGCRQNNPDICKYNCVDNICAFTSKDCICKHPSRAWGKKYKELAGKEI